MINTRYEYLLPVLIDLCRQRCGDCNSVVDAKNNDANNENVSIKNQEIERQIL